MSNFATVTGNVKDLTGTTAGSTVNFTLVGYNDNQPTVNGVSVIPSSAISVTPDPITGAFSATLYGNDVILAGGQTGVTFYKVSIKCTVVAGQTELAHQSYVFNSNTSYDLSNATPITTSPVVPTPTGDTTYARLDGGNQPFTGGVTAPSLTVTGTTTLGNTAIGTAKTLSVNNIKQQAGTQLAILDPLGVSHFFISSAAPYTNTFVNGNGTGVVFLGSAAKTSVDDLTGNITMSGSSSGSTVIQASATASGTLTLPAATDTLVGRNTTDTLTNKTITTLGLTGGGTNKNLRFNGSAQVINGNTTDDGTNFSTGTVRLQVQLGVTQGSGVKHQRFGATCTTSASAGATCTSAYTWTSAFADANYTVVCQGITQANTPTGPSIESITASGFTARVSTILAAASGYAGLDCIAMHD